jgi:NADH-quinone oxidoreductase subunit L
MILGHLLDGGHPFAFLAAAVGAFLTTYYSFRLIFVLLFPRDGTAEASTEVHGDHHSPGGERAMTVVLWCLAGVTLILGFFQSPLQAFLARASGTEITKAVHHAWLPVVACLVAAAAIFQAWFEFGRKNAKQIGWVERIPPLADLFGQRWYLDHLYRYLLDTVVYRGISRLFTANDQHVIDGAVDGSGRSIINLGRVVAWLHSGMIQYRLMVMFAAVILLILFLGWGG